MCRAKAAFITKRIAIKERRDRASLLCRCDAARCFHSSTGAFDMRKLLLTLVALMILGSGLAAYSMQAVAARANAHQASADLQPKIRLLSSANALQRATTACQTAERGKQATPALPQLT